MCMQCNHIKSECNLGEVTRQKYYSVAVGLYTWKTQKTNEKIQ